MSKLDEFIAQVKTVGLARTNRYTVIITPPPLLNDGGSLREFSIMCDQVQLPGINLATTQNRTFGEFREVPYEKLYGDIQLSFYVDNDLSVKRFFDDWMAVIQNNGTRAFEYYNNYISDMIINVEDLEDRVRYSLTAYECYPKTISPIQMDYSGKDVMKMQVTMQYKYWRRTTEGSEVPMTMPNYVDRDEMVPESFHNEQMIEPEFENNNIGNPMGDASGWGNGW
jgi:hypothetical protein